MKVFLMLRRTCSSFRRRLTRGVVSTYGEGTPCGNPLDLTILGYGHPARSCCSATVAENPAWGEKPDVKDRSGLGTAQTGWVFCG